MTGPAPAARRVPPSLAVLTGTAVFLALHLLFVLDWDGFASPPWPGYDENVRRGLLEPWFVHAPRSLWLTRLVFFAVALGFAFAANRRRWLAGAMLWLGAAIAIAGTWATTTARTLDWGWLGYFIYPFRIVLPILIGTAMGDLARRTLAARRA